MSFLYGIFFCITLYITWKPPHVQCKNKMFVNFGFVLITYIPFPFPFSLLYNSSSFYQCLYFVWQLVMYKLLTKILLSPSFCLKCSIPYESEVYFKSTFNMLEVHLQNILEQFIDWNKTNNSISLNFSFHIDS